MVVQNKELDAFSVCSSLQQLHAIIKHIGSNYNIHFEPFNHLDANLQQNLKIIPNCLFHVSPSFKIMRIVFGVRVEKNSSSISTPSSFRTNVIWLPSAIVNFSLPKKK